jgi:hypothetical protein
MLPSPAVLVGHGSVVSASLELQSATHGGASDGRDIFALHGTERLDLHLVYPGAGVPSRGARGSASERQPAVPLPRSNIMPSKVADPRAGFILSLLAEQRSGPGPRIRANDPTADAGHRGVSRGRIGGPPAQRSEVVTEDHQRRCARLPRFRFL